jgi:hypothetical protein
MKYENLKKYIKVLSEQQKKSRDLYKCGVDIMEFTDNYHTLFRILWQEILTDEGLDWLEWFIWEKGAVDGKIRKDIQAWDANGNPICEDLKGLHKYLVDNNYFKANQK